LNASLQAAGDASLNHITQNVTDCLVNLSIYSVFNVLNWVLDVVLTMDVIAVAVTEFSEVLPVEVVAITREW
jgi:hypothetical protein